MTIIALLEFFDVAPSVVTPRPIRRRKPRMQGCSGCNAGGCLGFSTEMDLTCAKVNRYFFFSKEVQTQQPINARAGGQRMA